MYRLSRNFGSLNLLEPQEPVQTCTATAWQDTYLYIYFISLLCVSFFWFYADRQFGWVHIAFSVLVSRLGVFSVVRSPFELCMRSVMNQQVTCMMSCWQNHKPHINKRLSVAYLSLHAVKILTRIAFSPVTIQAGSYQVRAWTEFHFVVL
jgi:hypothetical protein